MAPTIAPSNQSVTNGRLTLKKAHLEYLGNPETVDVTFGPGHSILLHNPQRREQLINQILGDNPGPLDEDEMNIELRLDSMAEACAVDEQGRMRLGQTHLERGKLTEKGCKVVVFARRRNGWLEIWKLDDFDPMVNDSSDPWLSAFNRLIQRGRKERSSDPAV
jgi:DNA-binding transcriptional regulator/RsmH inhibitor MraZ